MRVAGRPAGSRGLTLVEVMVVLALVVIVATFAMPTWRHWLARQELANRAQTLATALERARTEAIKRGHRVNLCKSPDAATCADDGDWSAGWIMHVDALAAGAARARRAAHRPRPAGRRPDPRRRQRAGR